MRNHKRRILSDIGLILVLALAAVASLLAACGNGQVILNLDVHSFLVDEGDSLTAPYDDAIPPGVGLLPPITIVPATEVNMIEGMGSVTLLEEGELFLGGEFINEIGTATAQLRVYVGATSSEVVLSGNPILSLVVSVTPSTTTPFSESILLDAATLDLFSEPSIWVRIDMQAQAPGILQPEPIRGEVYITALRARLVSSEDFLN